MLLLQVLRLLIMLLLPNMLLIELRVLRRPLVIHEGQSGRSTVLAGSAWIFGPEIQVGFHSTSHV